MYLKIFYRIVNHCALSGTANTQSVVVVFINNFQKIVETSKWRRDFEGDAKIREIFINNKNVLFSFKY